MLYFSMSHLTTAHPQVHQGDIYWVPLSEPGITHPHVVIQDDVLNHSRIATVVVCALTTNMRRAKAPGNVLLEVGEANLSRRSIVAVSQVSTVDKTQLGEYIGTLDCSRVEQILAGMRFIQSMTPSRQQAAASMSAVAVVKEFYRRMNSNDFRFAAQMLSDDYTLEWPQSKERIRGRANFVAVNEEYPASGRWSFTIHRIVGSAIEAVSEVSVTDGSILARAITFTSVQAGQITRQVEFWPDNYPAPANRAHLVEIMA